MRIRIKRTSVTVQTISDPGKQEIRTWRVTGSGPLRASTSRVEAVESRGTLVRRCKGPDPVSACGAQTVQPERSRGRSGTTVTVPAVLYRNAEYPTFPCREFLRIPTTTPRVTHFELGRETPGRICGIPHVRPIDTRYQGETEMKWTHVVAGMAFCMIGAAQADAGLFNLFRSHSHDDCCNPAPKCCAPKAKCCAPAPRKCCAPAPKCCAAKPRCCAPAPKCCAPAPKCCAPAPKKCCAPPPQKCCAPAHRCCAPAPVHKCCAPVKHCCKPAPVSCCGQNNCCRKHHCLFSGLFKRRNHCGNSCGNGCGCGRRHRWSLFGGHHNSCCGTQTCCR